jgi:hypothetical protein
MSLLSVEGAATGERDAEVRPSPGTLYQPAMQAGLKCDVIAKNACNFQRFQIGMPLMAMDNWRAVAFLSTSSSRHSQRFLTPL